MAAVNKELLKACAESDVPTLGELVRSGEISAQELVEAALQLSKDLILPSTLSYTNLMKCEPQQFSRLTSRLNTRGQYKTICSDLADEKK